MLHEVLQHVGRQKGRERRAEADIPDAEVQERQQDADGLLFVPGENEGKRKFIYGASKCILLTLLHLGIKNIRLGPSLPAFLSPNILNFLVENYGISPITTPEEDIKTLLNHNK